MGGFRFLEEKQLKNLHQLTVHVRSNGLNFLSEDYKNCRIGQKPLPFNTLKKMLNN